MELYDLEAEINILGSCLLSEKAIDQVSTVLIPDNFYRSANNHVYSAILGMWNNGQPIDLVTLADNLRKDKLLDLVGGSAYLASLTDSSLGPANVMYYCQIVKTFYQKRKLFNIGQYLVNESQDQSSDIQEIKSTIEKALLEIENKGKDGYSHIKNHITSVINEIEEDYKRKGKLKGIPTGFAELDRLTDGWQDSTYSVIGARPSIGKTASIIQMIATAAVENDFKVGLFTAEMATNLIVKRMFANIGYINQSAMRSGMLSHSDFASIQDAAAKLYESNIFIDDTPNIKINDLITGAKAMVRKENVNIIFIDYIGLITYSNNKIPRWEQFTEISKSLKGLARELKIPIVVLSQLSRDNEGKRPNNASLRESGGIEQDADIIILLHREKEPSETEDDLEIILSKQRNGPINTFEVVHQKAYNRMVSKNQESREEKLSKSKAQQTKVILEAKTVQPQKTTQEAFDEEIDLF